MSDPIDTATLRDKLRVYDQTLPRCTKVITRTSNHAPDYVAEEERGAWEMRLTYPCAELEGHDGPCREGRAILGWPGFKTVTALLDEVDELRAEVERLTAEVDKERAAVMDYLTWRAEMTHYNDAAREFINARDEVGDGVHHTIDYEEELP